MCKLDTSCLICTPSWPPPHTEAFHHRSARGHEIDLILVAPDGGIRSIEVKRSNAPSLSKAYHTAVGDVKAAHNFVVTPDSDRYPIGEITEVIGLRDLLAELRSQ